MQNEKLKETTVEVKLPTIPSQKEEGKKDKVSTDTKTEKPKGENPKGKDEPEKKAPAEKPARPSIPERDEKPKKEKEEAKKEPSNHWPLVALIVGALIAAAIYFKPAPTPPPSVAPVPVVDASESNRKKMEKAKVVEKETLPPVPVTITPVQNGGEGTEVLRATNEEMLKSIFLGWDSDSVPGYHVPLIKNGQGNPSPIVNGPKPFPLAPIGVKWEKVQYQIPTGKVFSAWATKSRPRSK